GGAVVEVRAGPIRTPTWGATFALGTTTVTCTATDAHDNPATGTFAVTVQDTTAPTISLPNDVTAEATGPNGAPVTFKTSAIDLRSEERRPGYTPTSRA